MEPDLDAMEKRHSTISIYVAAGSEASRFGDLNNNQKVQDGVLGKKERERERASIRSVCMYAMHSTKVHD
jgi:hypothetical protein